MTKLEDYLLTLLYTMIVSFVTLNVNLVYDILDEAGYPSLNINALTCNATENFTRLCNNVNTTPPLPSPSLFACLNVIALRRGHQKQQLRSPATVTNLTIFKYILIYRGLIIYIIL